MSILTRYCTCWILSKQISSKLEIKRKDHVAQVIRSQFLINNWVKMKNGLKKCYLLLICSNIWILFWAIVHRNMQILSKKVRKISLKSMHKFKNLYLIKYCQSVLISLFFRNLFKKSRKMVRISTNKWVYGRLQLLGCKDILKYHLIHFRTRHLDL